MSFFLIFKLFKLGSKEVHKRRHPEQYQKHQVWYENGNSEMAMASSSDNRGGNKLHRGPATPKYVLNTTVRFFQFVLGWTIVGLYGVDLHHAAQKGAYADAKWVYAEWTAGISVLTSSIHLLSLWCLERRRGRPGITSYSAMHLPFFVWEVLLCIFWLTLFGIFGDMYISEDPEGQSCIVRMKHAVWVDFVNLLLWCATATWTGLRWWRALRARNMGVQVPEKVDMVGNNQNINGYAQPAFVSPVYMQGRGSVSGDEEKEGAVSPVTARSFPRHGSSASSVSALSDAPRRNR